MRDPGERQVTPEELEDLEHGKFFSIIPPAKAQMMNRAERRAHEREMRKRGR